jgi:hypothetical protein
MASTDDVTGDDGVSTEHVHERPAVHGRVQSPRVSDEERPVAEQPNEASRTPSPIERPRSRRSSTVDASVDDASHESPRVPAVRRPVMRSSTGPSVDTERVDRANHIAARPALTRAPHDERAASRSTPLVTSESPHWETRFEPVIRRDAGVHATRAEQTRAPDPRHSDMGARPVVRVTIGRLEVRAGSPTSPAASRARATPSAPRVTLTDYLAQRRR